MKIIMRQVGYLQRLYQMYDQQNIKLRQSTYRAAGRAGFKQTDRQQSVYCKIKRNCATSGFRRSIEEMCTHLGYRVVYNNCVLPTFRDMSVLSSRVKQSNMILTHGGRGHLNCLNARYRGF